MPHSIRRPATNSKIGSEEKILGVNDDAWDTEILAPAVDKMKKQPWNNCVLSFVIVNFKIYEISQIWVFLKSKKLL